MADMSDNDHIDRSDQKRHFWQRTLKMTQISPFVTNVHKCHFQRLVHSVVLQ